MKADKLITFKKLKRDVAEITGHTYKETDEIIDEFWKLLVQEMFETGKEVNIYRYGNFYIAKGRGKTGGFSTRKEKSEKTPYFLRFDTSSTLRKSLMEKYGSRNYDVRPSHPTTSRESKD